MRKLTPVSSSKRKRLIKIHLWFPAFSNHTLFFLIFQAKIDILRTRKIGELNIIYDRSTCLAYKKDWFS